MHTTKETASFDKKEFVVFELGGERFGIELRQVREVAVLPAVTPVPSMPPWLLGVANLRGEVVPVVSLARAIGAQAADGDKMIVVDVASRPVGVVVAGVPRIERVDPSAIEPAPELVAARLKRDFIRGVVNESDGIVILLDLSAIVRLEEIAKAT